MKLLFVALVLTQLGPVPVPESAQRPTIEVRFGFDTSLDGLEERSFGGGEVEPLAHGPGWAVHYPAVCREPVKRCPRAILESHSSSWMNPGSRPVRWGASVLMMPDEVSAGSNVVQKGFSAAGSQFKLQVDGAKAYPSCVVAGGHIFTALVRRSIADGRWHQLDCARQGGLLTLTVDGVDSTTKEINPDLSISNNEPLRLGGKGIGPDNDQFHGAMDEVYLQID